MRVLAFDASTHAGWALLEGERGAVKPQIASMGLVENDRSIQAFGSYPNNYLAAASSIAERLAALVFQHRPDVIVIEETNMGRSRYAQKILEFIHCSLLSRLTSQSPSVPIVYISSSTWRKVLDIRLDIEQRKNNIKITKAKKLHSDTGIPLAVAKRQLGVKGKVTKKHLSVNRINEVYDLGFKVKDNDTAEAILLGLAFFIGAEPADGIL